MHPHTLHALAAADALRRALVALEERAREALRDAEAGSSVGDVSIPSQSYGCRRQLGGYGDPTANQALGAWAPGGPEKHAALLGDIMRGLEKIVATGRLPGAHGMDPLRRIHQAIPAMPPHVAGDLAKGLTNFDEKARRLLQMPPDLTPISGQCPACRTRGVLYSTSGWVVCRATGCTCTGPGCGCGMDEPAAGVGHIWDAAAFATTAKRKRCITL